MNLPSRKNRFTGVQDEQAVQSGVVSYAEIEVTLG